jgi:hypothetical protein
MYDFLITYSEVQRLISPSPMGVVKACYYLVRRFSLYEPQGYPFILLPIESHPCLYRANHQHCANKWPYKAFADHFVSK